MFVLFCVGVGCNNRAMYQNVPLFVAAQEEDWAGGVLHENGTHVVTPKSRSSIIRDGSENMKRNDNCMFGFRVKARQRGRAVVTVRAENGLRVPVELATASRSFASRSFSADHCHRREAKTITTG